MDLGTQRALPKYIPELNKAGGPRAVLRLLLAVFAAQMAVLLVIAAGLASWLRQPYLGTLREKILADPKISALDQLQLLGLLDVYGYLVIAALLALLFLGVCYDVFMAYLNSFFKQRAWNSIALAAGLLPSCSASPPSSSCPTRGTSWASWPPPCSRRPSPWPWPAGRCCACGTS